jgi:hypothetical protein
MSDSFDVVMAAYQETGTAERDFDALVRRVKDRAVRTEGVILVEHDAGGQVRVTQTGWTAPAILEALSCRHD